MKKIPRKIQATLNQLGISGVVNGFITRCPHDDWRKRCKGEMMTIFTGWDHQGEVVCVLVKPKREPWRLEKK